MAIYYPPTRNFIQKTLNAILLAGATTSATLNNATYLQNKLGVMIIDRVDANGTETPNSTEIISFAGTSGSTVTTLVRGLAGTTDQEHSVGAIVEFGPDVIWAQALIDSMLNLVDTAGALDTTKVVDLTTAQTLSKKTLKSSISEVLTTGGGTTAYTLTPSVAIGSYVLGQEFTIKMNATNTDASTINVSVLGAKNMTKGGATALAPGDLLIDAEYKIIYDGTQFQVIGISSAGSTVATQAEVATGTDNTKMVTPLAAQALGGADGWTPGTGTWTYNAPDKINVPSGAASIYQKGDRIKWTQTTVKYGVIVAVADTLLTIAVNTDYTVADATITLNYYSHQANPLGYPDQFNIATGRWLSIVGKTATLRGWDYVTVSSVATAEESITFGFTFSAIPTCLGCVIGISSPSEPNSIDDFAYGPQNLGITWTANFMNNSTSASYFQFKASSSFGANSWMGYQFIAIGTI